MRESPRIAAICGSLRDGSTTRTAAAHSLAAAERAGAETDLLDLRQFDLPVYDGDSHDAGDAPTLRERVRAADGVVLATPVYHGSYASGLKTALDYCGFDEFEGKPVGLLAVAGGRLVSPALLHLHIVCCWLRAHSLPYQVGVPDVSDAIRGGEVVDPDAARRIETLGERVTQGAVRFALDLPEVPAAR